MSGERLDLSRQDLRGRTFEKGELRGAVLDFARMEGCVLAGMDLHGASLRGTRLSYADLRGANLTSADLSRADLSFARLDRVEFRDATMLNTRVIGASLLGASWVSQQLRLAYANTAAWDITGIRPWITPGAQVPAALIVSHDGRLVAARPFFGAICIWETLRGRLVRAVAAQAAIVQCIDFAYETAVIATGAKDDTVRIWDLAKGEARLILGGHRDGVTDVAWHPDGQSLVSASDDLTLHFWETASGKRARRPEDVHDHNLVLDISRDGEILAAGNDMGAVMLMGAKNASRHEWGRHGEWVRCVAFSYDSRRLASGADDGKVRVFDCSNDEELPMVKVLRGHTGEVFQVAWSPDDKAILSASKDETVKLWSIETGKPLGEAPLVQGDTVAWDDDGYPLTYGLDTPDARKRKPQTEIPRRLLEAPAPAVRSMVWRRDGSTLVTAMADDSVCIWDLTSGAVLRRMKLKGAGHPGAAWNTEGTVLATPEHPKGIALWDITEGESLRVITRRFGPELSVAWSPDGSTLAVASTKRHLRLVDVAAGSIRKTLKAAEAGCFGPAWSPNGRELAVVCTDGDIHGWLPPMVLGEHLMEAEKQDLTCVTFSEDTRWMAGGTKREDVVLSEHYGERRSLRLEGHPLGTQRLSWSHNGRWLAAATQADSILLWEPATQRTRPSATLEIPFASASSMVWSPDSRYLATGCTDGSVKVWELSSMRCLMMYLATEGGHVAMRPSDGRYRLTGDVGDCVGHAIGFARYKLGELDEIVPGGLRFPEGEALLYAPGVGY